MTRLIERNSTIPTNKKQVEVGCGCGCDALDMKQQFLSLQIGASQESALQELFIEGLTG